MQTYSHNPRVPLAEVEVFIGNILGKTGAQSRKQREDSTTMKELFERDAAYIIKRILHDDTGYSTKALARSMACLAVSLEQKEDVHRNKGIVSFKYIAAAVCLKEVDKLTLV